ncbi:MAG: 4Fe-4S dicluster domain-containing protein [Myxococcota bacterium]
MSRPQPKGTIVLDTTRCKGCELCIPACPPHVLRMSTQRNASGYLLPELLEGCTGCGACLLVCPDYCFEIYRLGGEKPATRPASASKADTRELPIAQEIR